MNFDLLADSLILEVFKYLTIKELCQISRVCKRWNKIAKDNSLWRDIDISDTRLDLKKAWKFYRARLSDCLIRFKIRGFYSSNVTVKQKKAVISNALLEDLRTNCPNIRELILEHTNLADISASKLPRTLTSLTLVHCGWPLQWLSEADLPDIRSLAFLNCTRIDDAELKTIVRFTTIEKLTLEGLYRVKDDGIRNVVENLTALETLDLEGLNISDLGVHHICRNVVNLKSLKISKCPSITNSSVQTIADSLAKLEILDISGNDKLDTQCFECLVKLKKLRNLVCSFEKDSVDSPLSETVKISFTGK